MVDVGSFAAWLEDELETRKLSQAELARWAGVTRSAINNLLAGSRGPGPELCRSIASALQLSEEYVFRKAGLLSPKPDENPLHERMVNLMDQLPEDEQDELIEIALVKVRKYKKD